MLSKKKLKAALTDQANQILYFEASMSDEKKALKELVLRLDSIYWDGYNTGMSDAVNNDDLGGSNE